MTPVKYGRFRRQTSTGRDEPTIARRSPPGERGLVLGECASGDHPLEPQRRTQFATASHRGLASERPRGLLVWGLPPRAASAAWRSCEVRRFRIPSLGTLATPCPS